MVPPSPPCRVAVAAKIRPTFSLEKNSAGDTTPEITRTKPFIASGLPCTAPSSLGRVPSPAGTCATAANPGDVPVFYDVFESQAKLDAFGAKLMPLLQKLGIQAKPTVLEVHNIIDGP